MSLYNALFGQNKFANVLLHLLGATQSDIPRYRDCFVDEKGRIVIHTRTGGGNRDYYESEELCRDNYPEYFGDGKDEPSGPWNADLRTLPGFLYDRDDDFDATYANFLYQPADSARDVIDAIKASGGQGDPTQAWQDMFEKLRAGNKDDPAVKRAMEVGEQILGAIKSVDKPDTAA